MRKIVRDNKTGRAIGTEIIWTNRQLIEFLKEVADLLGNTPTFDDAKSIRFIHGGPHPKTIQERFGSWSAAVAAAGLVDRKEFSESFLVSEIERFIKVYGHVPSTNEFRYNHNFPGIKAYKRIFGSFNACLVSLGYTPVVITKKSAYSVNVIAMDGHICDSNEEAFVDNWMFEHEIVHGTQPLYPRHSELNPKGFIRADFMIDLAYIEYAGLITRSFYRERLDRKLALAAQLGLDIVVIKPTDLSHLETVLGRFEKERNTLQPSRSRHGIVRHSG